MLRVLFADDEPKLRRTVCEYMGRRGFSVTAAADGGQALSLALSESFDLIILDVMMPEKNGIETLKEIRAFSDVPVLLLSALGEEEDVLKAYLHGADDYITKPYPLSVLCEKCAAMIARSKGTDKNGILTACGIVLDTAKMQLRQNGAVKDVSGKEYYLLEYFMRNKNVVLSRERILNAVWGYDFDGDARVVDSHVRSLRRLLGEKAFLLKTVIGAGYKFGGEEDE